MDSINESISPERVQIASSVWWSPRGGHVLYAKYNDSLIEENLIKLYGNIYDVLDLADQSANVIRQKFPKVSYPVPKNPSGSE